MDGELLQFVSLLAIEIDIKDPVVAADPLLTGQQGGEGGIGVAMVNLAQGVRRPDDEPILQTPDPLALVACGTCAGRGLIAAPLLI